MLTFFLYPPCFLRSNVVLACQRLRSFIYAVSLSTCPYLQSLVSTEDERLAVLADAQLIQTGIWTRVLKAKLSVLNHTISSNKCPQRHTPRSKHIWLLQETGESTHDGLLHNMPKIYPWLIKRRGAALLNFVPFSTFKLAKSDLHMPWKVNGWITDIVKKMMDKW